MARILVAMPQSTYDRMRMREFESELAGIGDVSCCLNPRELSDSDYSGLWRDADAVVTGWGVRPPTVEMLEQARSLKIISHTAGSIRMFPRQALELGITITSARAAIARSVAEYCIHAAISGLRRASPTQTLFDKTVGLVGFGYIGRLFRELLRPFGCRVIVYDPFLQNANEHGVEVVPLEELLRICNVISLHAPEIPETRGMIGQHELALIQDRALLINSARGKLIDTEALTRELATGRFTAVLDVTDPEPLPEDHPIRSMHNVILTPHVAGPTEDELPSLTRMALTDLGSFLRGESPLHAISLEQYDRMSF